MKYKIIVAMDEKNGIGKANALPWHYSEDLKYFSKTTKSKGLNINAVIMGRKTYESIGRALPERVNYVLSRSLKRENVDSNILVFNNLEELLKDITAKQFNECWIIGGAKIYNLFLEKTNLISEIYVTKINKDYDCDTFFPTSILNDKFLIIRVWPGTSKDINYIVYTRNIRKYTNYLSK